MKDKKRTTTEWIEHHLNEISHAQSENILLAEDAPEYLRVIALSLHTLATIEHIKLRADGRINVLHHEEANLKKRIEEVDTTIKGSAKWGNV